MLDPADLVVVQLAGDVASRFDREPADLLGRPLAGLCARLAGCAQAFRDAGSAAGYLGSWAIAGSGPLDVAVHRADGRLILEFEPGPEVELSGPASLANVEEAARCFERARDRHELYRQAAIVFRQLTGFDRVMLYRFLDDGAGAVVAEDQADGLHSFLNHRFPASDIPKQARALYARNLIRVIPDAGYVPAPLLGMGDLHLPPGWGDIPWRMLFDELEVLPGTVANIELPARYYDVAEESVARVRELAGLPAR